MIGFKIGDPVITVRQNLGFVIRVYDRSAKTRDGWTVRREPGRDSVIELKRDLCEVLWPFLQEFCPGRVDGIRGGIKASIGETGAHVLFEGELRKVLLEYGVIKEGEGV